MSEIEQDELWREFDQNERDITEGVSLHHTFLYQKIFRNAEILEKLLQLKNKQALEQVKTVDNICAFISDRATQFKWCSAQWIRENLPSKYKHGEKSRYPDSLQYDYPDVYKDLVKKHEQESSANNSSPPIGEITFYDCPDYTLLTELRSAIDDALTIIETDPDWFTQEKTTIAEWDEVSELYEMVTDLKQAGDDRFDIRTLDARRYIEALSIKSIRRVMDVYHAFLKLTVRLSTKQLGKFMRGKSRHSPVEPQTREEAIRKGFSGKPCPECKSWRYEEKVNSLGSANIHPRDEDLRNIIPPTSFYRCYSCGFVPEIELPEIVDRSEVKRTE